MKGKLKCVATQRVAGACLECGEPIAGVAHLVWKNLYCHAHCPVCHPLPEPALFEAPPLPPSKSSTEYPD